MAGANVHVMGGVNDGMGGLQESQSKFRKHHKEVGDALLNVSGIGTPDGKPVDKDADRLPMEFQKFPMMIYHAEKGEEIINSDQELADMLRKGWREEPYIKAQVALEDPKAEKLALEAKLKQKDGEIALMNDTLRKALARLDQLEEKATAPSK